MEDNTWAAGAARSDFITRTPSEAARLGRHERGLDHRGRLSKRTAIDRASRSGTGIDRWRRQQA